MYTGKISPVNFFQHWICFYLLFIIKTESVCYIYNLDLSRGMISPLHGAEVKASARNAGDLGLIRGLGRSPGEGNGNPLQYSCLENPMDGGAWWATVHGSQRVRHDWSDLAAAVGHIPFVNLWHISGQHTSVEALIWFVSCRRNNFSEEILNRYLEKNEVAT